MLMLIIGNVDAVWIPSLWVLLSPGLLVVKCLVFRPSSVLMNIICLPSEERVLHAVSCALPLLTEASSLLRYLAGLGRVDPFLFPIA